MFFKWSSGVLWLGVLMALGGAIDFVFGSIAIEAGILNPITFDSIVGYGFVVGLAGVVIAGIGAFLILFTRPYK